MNFTDNSWLVSTSTLSPCLFLKVKFQMSLIYRPRHLMHFGNIFLSGGKKLSFGFCEGVVTPGFFPPPTHGVNIFGLSSVKLKGLFILSGLLNHKVHQECSFRAVLFCFIMTLLFCAEKALLGFDSLSCRRVTQKGRREHSCSPQKQAKFQLVWRCATEQKEQICHGQLGVWG